MWPDWPGADQLAALLRRNLTISLSNGGSVRVGRGGGLSVKVCSTLGGVWDLYLRFWLLICTWQSPPQGQILLMQPELLPDLTPILDHLTGKLASMFCAISRAQCTTRWPISLLIHLSHSLLTLMWTMEAILTMASPLEIMWS